jgi:hypothetical protein
MPRNTTRKGLGRTGRPMPDPHQRTIADRILQHEIDNALANLADSLPVIIDLRIARVLSTILEPSWAEHTSFQDEALFPILARRHDGVKDVKILLARLEREHAELTECHLEIALKLELLIGGRLTTHAALGRKLRGAKDVRQRHREAETQLDALLPRALSAPERKALEQWLAERPAPPFPLNIVLDSLD